MINEDDTELHDFRSVVYEIRMYGYMRKLGFNIRALSYNKTPDFLVPNKFYIECIISTPGQEGIINVSQIEGIESSTIDDPRFGVRFIRMKYIQITICMGFIYKRIIGF
jgi:hypothetical protein